jgi:cytochrome c
VRTHFNPTKLGAMCAASLIIVSVAACAPAETPAAEESIKVEAPAPVVEEVAAVPVAAELTELQARGKRIYLRCAACHSKTEAEGNKVGPHLEAIFGRAAGSLEDFRYSGGMQEQDFVWDVEKMDAWIQRPQGVVPGTSMAFAGITRPNDREALIAYLETL